MVNNTGKRMAMDQHPFWSHWVAIKNETKSVMAICLDSVSGVILTNWWYICNVVTISPLSWRSLLPMLHPPYPPTQGESLASLNASTVHHHELIAHAHNVCNTWFILSMWFQLILYHFLNLETSWIELNISSIEFVVFWFRGPHHVVPSHHAS